MASDTLDGVAIDHFVSPGGVVQDAGHVYAAGSPQLNEWSLIGDWTIGNERAMLDEKHGGTLPRPRRPGLRVYIRLIA